MFSLQVARPEDAFLTETDGFAVSFWNISIAMIAATVCFYAEAGTALGHWKLSPHVGSLVTLVAGVHYMYMREFANPQVCVFLQVHRLEHRRALADY